MSNREIVALLILPAWKRNVKKARVISYLSSKNVSTLLNALLRQAVGPRHIYDLEAD
jgi:hypothetical protein